MPDLDSSETYGRPTTIAVISVTLAVLMSACILGGCSNSTNSVAAYCQTFFQKGTQLRNQFRNSDNNMSQDPLSGIVSLLTAPSQLATFFAELQAVAPSSIEPQVAQIQQAFQQEANSAGQDASDPLGGLIGGLASAVETGPAWSAVNSWTDANCGPPPGTKWLNGSSS